MKGNLKKSKRLIILTSLLVSAFVSLIFNLATYGYPASGSVAVAPPPPPLQIKCFICGYEERTECNSLNKADCEKTIDCEYSGGVCQSGFRASCYDMVALVKNNYDYTRIIDHMITGNDDWPTNCTTKDYAYFGHSNPAQCEPLFNKVQACIEGSNLTSLYWLHDGCSTFEDQNKVLDYAKKIQDAITALPPPKNDLLVVVTANQADATYKCKSYMKVIITKKGVTTSYGSCHYDSSPNYCFEQYKTISCTDKSDSIQEETCCDTGKTTVTIFGGTSYTTAWFKGGSCP